MYKSDYMNIFTTAFICITFLIILIASVLIYSSVTQTIETSTETIPANKITSFFIDTINIAIFAFFGIFFMATVVSNIM